MQVSAELQAVNSRLRDITGMLDHGKTPTSENSCSRPLMTKSQIKVMKKEIASGRQVLHEEELDYLAKRLKEKDYMTEGD